MSIASSSSQVDPAYKVYRRYKEKYEDWDKVHDKPLLDGSDGDDDEPPPPPCIVVVQGPPHVGKSLLIKSLVNYFTTEPSASQSPGPITIILGNRRKRLQFVECPDDINGMIDAAKYADLVLFLVDASYGFEAETFEFVNLLQAHGFPEVMGVFTHLDEFKDEKELKEATIECLQDHFRTEIYQAARISCLSGLYNDLYRMEEVQQLAQHISMLQPSSSSHPYVLVDRIDDVTPPELLHEDAFCKRKINLYGYLRGCNINKSGAKVHLAGVGDFRLASVTSTTDPFPFPASDMGMSKDFVVDMDNESFRTGTYLRLEVHDVPFQVVENYDPCHPILVVGLEEEENVGYVQVRLKRHNWHIKLLKSSETVTVSAGWRRYLTKPIYTSQIDDARHQIDDFISEDLHCVATFWGPPAPPGTRIAVVHETKEVFRIAAKGVVLDPKSHMKIMKRSGLDGQPCKILDDRTALIKFKAKDIVDIADYEGSPVRTNLRCIWGKVNKAENRKGIARCTFEKKICMRDTFTMPVFVQIGAPRFFKPFDDGNYKDSVAKRRLGVEEQRRRVEIIDEEPCSHPDKAVYTMFNNIKYMTTKGKETVVVMAEEKRLELLRKQQMENDEKLMANGFGW